MVVALTLSVSGVVGLTLGQSVGYCVVVGLTCQSVSGVLCGGGFDLSVSQWGTVWWWV